MTTEFTEETLNQIETELKSKMPEDCYNMFKRFTLCKLDYDEEMKKKLGVHNFRDYKTDPFSRIDGCKNEFYKYDKCYSDFIESYVDMHNYVADIKGEKSIYDRKELDRDLEKNKTQYNFGLNKF